MRERKNERTCFSNYEKNHKKIDYRSYYKIYRKYAKEVLF